MTQPTAPSRSHWQAVYTSKAPVEVSWYQPVPVRSLALIESARVHAPTARGPATPTTVHVIDIGGGASTLVDHLAANPRVEICVVDIAAAALTHAEARIGAPASSRARFVEADATGPLSEIADGWANVWHDRAVFHFLTTPEARLSYARNLARILKPGGTAIIATFAPDGPEKCSGLPVRRYDGAGLAAELSKAGRPFILVDEQREEHVTPWGAAQKFIYAVLRTPQA